MSLDFNKIEEEILQFWEKEKIFEKTLDQNKDLPKFSFYDGPPFATGLPHYGHLLAGTIKDVVTRFAHQSGHYVERRFGWDCHGLPVEYEIDQALGIKGPEDVEKMGIEAYNAECRKIVMRYSSEWVKIVKRMGRWIDFENDYKTMYPQFMESVWWVFKQLHDKGLVYQGYKVMPYSTACATPLSNFESGQNYKEVSDPSVIVTFPILVDGKPSNKNFLVWTTTPWTLPSNLALCCNADLDYVEVEEIKTGIIYVCLETRLEFIFKKNHQSSHKILRKFKGSELKGMEYEPLFDYYHNFKQSGAFKVVTDGYVSADSGTGIVHQAPYFGEDDNRVCLAYKIIDRDGPTVCPIDSKGRFIEPVTDFLGLYIKDADKVIIKTLKQRNRMFRDATVNHSYPFCWRSDTPLIYRAVPSWFIRVEQMRENLLKRNAETYWVPEFIKEGRFANWLKDARDWAVSRNRYWGTPIPLWVSDDHKEIICIGSIAELEELSGVKIDDLHRENVDKITIPSKQGKGLLRRVPEVFDCWFESGSMPYAQQHYPFENTDKFDASFPADFIAEGVDQTRGWFYTLLVISTALFNKPPYKNLIVNGLVLASDGQKMSKRKKNYPDPMEVIGKFGADALRLYVITSPAVRAEALKFKEEGVKEILKEVIIPLCNSCRFLAQSIQVYEQDHGKKFKLNDSSVERPNIMDQWIVSFTQSLINFVRLEMSKYRLYTVVPRLVKYVDHLTNWYIRMNRLRLKGREGETDCLSALSTLYSVITQISTLMAPFTPFISEYIYKDLVQLASSDDISTKQSIHLLSIPEQTTKVIDLDVERKVSAFQRVIDLGRVIRDRKTLPLKMPLAEVVVISSDKSLLQDVEEMAGYIKLELNVEEVITTENKEKFGVKIKAQPDIKLLGARLRGDSKKVIDLIKNMSELDLGEYQSNPGGYKFGQHTLEEGEIKLVFTFENDSDKPKAGDAVDASAQPYEANSDGNMIVLLHTIPNQELADRGFVREFVNRIQKLRKKAGLVPTDSIAVQYSVLGDSSADSDEVKAILAREEVNVSQTIKCSSLEHESPDKPFTPNQDSAWEQVNNIRDTDIRIRITKLS